MEQNLRPTTNRLHEFDPTSYDWEEWEIRFDTFLEVESIEDDTKKRNLLINALGVQPFKTLISICKPNKPTEYTYKELIGKLRSNYARVTFPSTERIKFFASRQQSHQSLTDFANDLRDKVTTCQFPSDFYEQALITAFVGGLQNDQVHRHLMQRNLTTFEETINAAKTIESVLLESSQVRSTLSEEFSVNKIDNKAAQRANIDKKETCLSCGSSGHARSVCRFRNSTCYKCNREGHIAKACMSKSTSSKFKVNTISLVSQAASADDHPIRIQITVDDIQVNFELDTGSPITIISEHVWRILGEPKLRPIQSIYSSFTGHPVRLKGKKMVKVNYDGQCFQLPLVVGNETSSNIIGRNWINILHLNTRILDALMVTKNSGKHISYDLESKFTRPIHKIYDQPRLEMLLRKYANVLSKELGHCTKVKAHIQIKFEATPKFFKPRPLPFAYLNGIKEEIQRNIKAGILQRIDTSAWAAPIVPVKKPNGKIRICGDFKVTINPEILVDQHPIPSIDELLTHLNNGKRFIKLDLSDAYLQVELDDESKKFVVINTPLGLFQYNRMPFGISNAPAIFQRTMDQVIAGIPNCIAYLDDILITGANDDEHFQTLEMVLLKLSEFGFKCNPDKCSFLKNEVSYLGFIIDKNGKRSDPKRVEAIAHMPIPKNVKEVEAFIGKVNYYGKFLSNFSDKCKPLNALRRANVKWNWNQECQKAYDSLRQEIAKATTLVHFDPKLPLILATDASSYGLGAVIMHRYPDGSERPIAHASKTLTISEKNYSQIEKEALSIIYGIKKFHQYLAGRLFELNTDHQPLLAIFNPTKGIPVSTANRLQRWAICLMGYNYKIRYKPTICHANADALSRLPVGPDKSFVDKDAIHINCIQTKLIKEWPIRATEIVSATNSDRILRIVKRFTLTKWPPSISKAKEPELIPYYTSRHSLSVVNGCLLRDTQLVIPKVLQRRVLHLLHRSHLGTVKMKQLARSHCWWPGINSDIVNIIKSCSTCEKLQPLPKQEFKSWKEPEHVWSRVHMDFAGPIWDSKWLILIDAKSKFPIVVDMNNDTTAKNLCNVLEQIIDWFGPPASLVSDNGPPFNSNEMVKFYMTYGIDHITSPPYHPASNGIAERFVRSFKEAMLKQQQSGVTNRSTALRNVLRNYRWTPHTSTGVSPASMMFKHSIRTELDMMKPHKSTLSEQKTKFKIGDAVWTLIYKPSKQRQWESATITKILGSTVYKVKSSDGQHHKRHQNQLRPRCTTDVNSFEIDILPDDTLDTKSPSTTVQSFNLSSPRYPTRIRKPPDRYSPS
ncbi:unnamed protein product [Rotaria sp. Silwood2]|nr:unnamed protein product [Rotaria sp. Silwood2]